MWGTGGQCTYVWGQDLGGCEGFNPASPARPHSVNAGRTTSLAFLQNACVAPQGVASGNKLSCMKLDRGPARCCWKRHGAQVLLQPLRCAARLSARGCSARVAHVDHRAYHARTGAGHCALRCASAESDLRPERHWLWALQPETRVALVPDFPMLFRSPGGRACHILHTMAHQRIFSYDQPYGPCEDPSQMGPLGQICRAGTAMES